MKKALAKDILTEIKGTKSRFLAIFAIVALGVAFFAGVKATGPDMRVTGDDYFDSTRFMDIRLVSTYGFTDNDIEAIKKVEGIEGIHPTYSMDAIARLNDKDQVLKVLALPLDKLNTEDEDFINRPTLVEGRYPKNPYECVVEEGAIVDIDLSLGSTVTLTSGTDENIEESLEVVEYTVVGIVENPNYISYERGTSSIGNGKISAYIMIPEENFKLSVYTDVYITSEKARLEQTYDEAYEEIIDELKDKLTAVAEVREVERYNEIVAEAEEKLQEGKDKLAQGEEEFNNKISDAEKKLADASSEISKGQQQLNYNKKQYSSTVSNAEKQINDGYTELSAAEQEYKKSYEEFIAKKTEAEAQIAEAEETIKDSEAKIATQEQLISQAESAIAEYKEELEGREDLSETQKRIIKEAIAIAEKAIEGYRVTIADARAELESGKAQLSEQKAVLKAAEAEFAEAEKKLEASRASLDSESNNLETEKIKAQEQFASAQNKINDSKGELLEGQQELAENKLQGEEELQKARDEIASAEADIASIEVPTWYILGRETNYGYMEYGSAADRMDAVAAAFPVFFFLIAALVSLTTMTRMVDEQRIYIGTYKAMGYSKLDIASKYLLYAIFASLLGGITGVVVGFQLFPRVIFNAFRIMYTLPEFTPQFLVTTAVIAVALSVITTVAATWFACYKELMATPALLMRPKAPKAGKRIILERIKPLWSRMSFFQKVAARNILRYKKRFFMTILGVGGCTALLLTGFGLKDSILDIVGKQYGEVFKYNMIVDLKEDVSGENGIKALEYLSKDRRVDHYTATMDKNVELTAGDVTKTVTLVVPENPEELKEFVELRTRVGQNPLNITDQGIIITEKLAKGLDVSVGDSLNIKDDEERSHELKIIGITENYAGHYAYIAPELYESIYGEAPEYQRILALLRNPEEVNEDELSNGILELESISTVTFTTSLSKSFGDVVTSLNYVIIVLIVSAGALAFIVLYNLTNINISERIREIATIKVLGFYDKEVSSYVYRENAILSVLGALLGLLMGIFLHKFIVVTSEVENVMFGRQIKPLSYVYSFLLTMIFSLLVNYVMHKRLKKVKMVESLKSVD